jgi:hypothetical protein
MNLEHLLIVSLAISGIAFTITVTSIFKGFREHVSGIHEKLEELIHCPWCLSHWLFGFFLIFTQKAYVIYDLWIVDYAITGFAMITISGLCHFILLRAYEPVAKAMVARQLEKMKAQAKSE